EVEVGLARPGDEVPGLAEVIDHQRRELHQLRPHVVGAQGGRVDAGDQPAAARGADRGVGEAAGEPGALGREPVEVGGDRVRVAVAAEVRADVLGADQHDVRAVRGG